MNPGAAKKRVLVVDDEPIVIESMRSLLRHYEVTGERDPRAALHRLKAKEEFAVVLSDVRMPNMNGVVFYNELVQLGLAKRVAFITGEEQGPALRTLVALGVPCLAKPLELDRVHAVVNAIAALNS